MDVRRMPETVRFGSRVIDPDPGTYQDLRKILEVPKPDCFLDCGYQLWLSH
jgi:hypothetical protein